MPTTAKPKPEARFAAYAADEGPRHCHAAPEASNFEEAALEFTELWHPAAGEDGEVTVIVLDRSTGREQCFTVDLGAGEAAPC